MRCDIAWTDTDPRLPHGTHRCVFSTSGPHSRHECRCSLNLHGLSDGLVAAEGRLW